MRIRWLIRIAGTVEGCSDGVNPGDEMDVPDVNGARYIANGHAEELKPPREERAVAPSDDEEHAVANRPPVKRTTRTRK